MRDIIIIGPKKTATTSLYQAISLAKPVNHVLIGKESNQFINQRFQKILKNSPNPIIDISPEYYTSFRALINIERFASIRNARPLIIALIRDHDERNLSHYLYMKSKGIISKSLTEREVEVICLSNIGIWQRFSFLEINVLTISDAVKILETELGVALHLQSENAGDRAPVSITLLKFLKFLNHVVIRIVPKSRARVHLAAFVGRIMYRQISLRPVIDEPPAELLSILKRILG